MGHRKAIEIARADNSHAPDVRVEASSGWAPNAKTTRDKDSRIRSQGIRQQALASLSADEERVMSSNDPAAQSLNVHLRTLGGLWIVYGVIRLALATLLILYSGTATVMFGALLNRAPDPFTLMGVFHLLYIVMIALSVVCGILGIMAGLALIGGQGAGRMLALIAGFLSLSNIPLGTTLGIYTLVVLLPPAGAQSR